MPALLAELARIGKGSQGSSQESCRLASSIQTIEAWPNTRQGRLVHDDEAALMAELARFEKERAEEAARKAPEEADLHRCINATRPSRC